MKKSLLIFCLTFNYAIAQEISFSTGMGYAQGEGNIYKKLMLYKESTFGYEKQIKNDYFFFTGVGKSVLQFSYNDTGNINVFTTRSFITVQLAARKYFFLNKKSWFFIQVGPAFNYYLLDKKELKSYFIDESIEQRYLGWTLGAKGIGAYKRQLTNRSFFDVGFETQQTFLTRYKQDKNKIIFNTNSLRLGFSWNLAKE